jgi:hypothetical protein
MSPPGRGSGIDRPADEPTFFPHASEAVWTLAEDRSVDVVEHADGAGSSVDGNALGFGGAPLETGP